MRGGGDGRRNAGEANPWVVAIVAGLLVTGFFFYLEQRSTTTEGARPTTGLDEPAPEASGATPTELSPTTPDPPRASESPTTSSPQATVPPDTTAGSILQPGQTWRAGTKEIRLVNYWFDQSCYEDETNEGVLINFDLVSRSSDVSFHKFSTGFFSIVDNRGRWLPVGGWGDIICNWSIEQDDDCQDYDFQLEPNEVYRPFAYCAAYSSYRDMSSTIATWTDLSDPQLTELTVYVDGLAGVEGAAWRIPISH